MKIQICAVGRLRSGPLRDLYDDYVQRLPWSVDEQTVAEYAQYSVQERRKRSADKLVSAAQGFVIALDKTGRVMSSRAFAKAIETWFGYGHGRISFLIGGADGLSKAVLEQTGDILSFGAMTWPHLLARVMLAEQLCRAAAIHRGHPYHRDLP